MVQDYANMMYVPSMDRISKISSNDFAIAKELSEWMQHMKKSWPQVFISAEKTMNQLKEQHSISGENINITASVSLGDIEPSSVRIEIYYGYVGKNGIIENPEIKSMTLKEKNDSGIYIYSADINLNEGGEYGYTLRVLPYHPELLNVYDLGLIKWVVQ
jgi:starch phosphorylase